MKITIFFLIAFLGFGCTAKKLAVDNADTLISYQVQKRLPLYKAQKDELDSDIVKFLNDAKPMAQEMVPIVDEIKLDSQSKVETQYLQLETFYQKLAQNFSKLMSKHMAKLDAKQQKDFFKILNGENEEIRRKAKKDRVSEIEDRFKMFMGSVSDEQKKVLESYSDYFNKRAELRLENRKKLHDEFKKIYAKDAPLTAKEESFQEAFVNYQDESIKTSKNLEIIKKLLPSVTDKQREHFREHTQEIKELVKYFIQTDY